MVGGGVCAGADDVVALALTLDACGSDETTLVAGGIGAEELAPGVGGIGGRGMFVGGPLLVFTPPSGLDEVALASRCSVTRVIVSKKARISSTPSVRLL